jgi:hypothetical protein
MSQIRFLDRREFLKLGSGAAIVSMTSRTAGAAAPSALSPGTQPAADYTVRIATGLIELSPEHIVSTTLYNGPGNWPL